MLALYISIPIVVILGIWLFLIAPGKNKRMDRFKTVKYAHRGLHGTVDADTFAAENSLTAFARAVDHGFGIELDVHVTSDGEVVVFHDNTLDRVTGFSGSVKDFTLDELRKLSLLGTEDTIPTLREVLDLVDGKVPLLVELKESNFNHAISEKTAEILKDYKGEFIVESFSPFAFGAIKEKNPGVPCGFLVHKYTENKKYRAIKYRLMQRFLFNFVARPSFIAMDHKNPKLFPIGLIKKLFGTPLIAWTVRSKEEEATAYQNGFSGVIFEGYLPE